jgi:protoporphyrinogen oxidase
MERKTALIIGAGPAGLTAAYELIARTDIRPIVLERSRQMGGLSRTECYKGNRIDIGGHRFFSKSDRVMNWWLKILPLEKNIDTAESSFVIAYHGQRRTLDGLHAAAPGDDSRVMLVRHRKSRIYFLRKFFNYPISLSVDTLRKLGLIRTMRIGFSYMRSAAFPIRQATNLEEFFINRFGRELYRTFFKSYTEKIWGIGCNQISAEWGAQRIKGLSIFRTIAHFGASRLRRRPADISQKNTETSLIERFLYPKYGPGQMWEEVAGEITRNGGEIVTGMLVEQIELGPGGISSVTAVDQQGNPHTFPADYFFSTMPIKDLIRGMGDAAPAEVRQVSDGLIYRDFITVGLLVKELKVKEDSAAGQALIRDNWIYIQEPDVLAGRLQIFNNWSPFLVANPHQVWLGVEYFCNETDALWCRSDESMTALAAEELDHIGILDRRNVVDSVVIRVPKTYPAYFGSYDRFPVIREFIDRIPNLFLIGRNGMHRYNNQDHSMLTAMVAVDNIVAGCADKSNIWEVNTEESYHETKDSSPSAAASGALRDR